jgi:hypothetical protein
VNVDFSRLRPGDIVAGLGGVALLIAMFLDWFGIAPVGIGGTPLPGGINIPGPKETGADAWQSLEFIDFCLLLTGLVAVKAAALRVLGKRLAGPFPMSAAVCLLGAVAATLILWRIFDPPFDGSLKVGIFLGLAGTLAITYGGYVASLEDGFKMVVDIGGRTPAKRASGTTAKRPAKK